MNRALNPQRWLALALAAQLGLGQPLVAIAQEAPLPAPRPVDGRTTVTESANGTPVVNISAPNAAGVSHNRFSSYDVGTGGLVLNNSATNAVSLIGGGTIGNQNLANGPAASLILNEVTGHDAASMLRGYQEILGPSAELVIANPWGITCDGCGFINTPRVTLTTGTPTMAGDGSLAGFTINGGRLAVGAEGLDATRQQALDLLAREVRIDGNVFAGYEPENVSGDVQIVGGAHQFDYNTRAGSALPDTPPGSAPPSSAPQIAIDSSALGGVYADRIRLLVNEQGAGVRAAGNLAATGSDLDIDANGRVELRAAASAERDFNVRGTDVTIDQAGDDPYVYAGRDLAVTASGTLTLGAGGVGGERNTSFSGAAVVDDGGTDDLRFSGDDGALTVDATGDVTLNGGTWTAPTLAVNGDAVRVGADSVLYATAGTGDALTLQAAGSLAVDGAAYSAADARLRADHLEIGADGVVGTTGHLDVATHPTSPNAVINHGSLSGGTVNIDARGGTGNTGLIYAEDRLDIRGELLANGATGEIVAGTADGGTVNITTTEVLNDGTIWSDGDLTLATTRLRQEINANGGDAIVGAGRDLALEFNDAAELGAGDLYAGRDLSIRGEHVSDTGSTGTSNTAADLRYAGRDLTAQATTDVEIAGGQWVSEGSLTVEGDNVLLGGTADVALFGAQSGAGTTAITARTGGIGLLDNAAVFSGGDLALTQPQGLQTGTDNVLQAEGTLSIDASDVDNGGTIAAAEVALGTNAQMLGVVNRGTGIIYGSDRIAIGNGNENLYVDSITNEASADPADPDTGIFGGAVDWYSTSLDNFGLMEITGGQISTLDFVNHDTGALRSFSGAGSNGLNVAARTLWNEGFLYDSSALSLNASYLTNAPTGTIGSGGTLRLHSTSQNADPIDNVGSIWGYDVDIFAQRGIINGRDRGIATNRDYPGTIYAGNLLNVWIGSNSTLTNFGDLESSGDIILSGGYNTGISNRMSMVDESETIWLEGDSPRTRSGDLGFRGSNPNGGSGNRQNFDYGNEEYYWFSGADFWNDAYTYAYLDRETAYVDIQALTPAAAAIQGPSIRAGWDLFIQDFQSITNLGGVLSANNDLRITSDAPGASVSNLSHNLLVRDRIYQVTGEYRCLTTEDDPINCGLRDSLQSLGPIGGFNQPPIPTTPRPGAPVFGGRIYAGNTLDIQVNGTVTNATGTTPYAGSMPVGPGVVGVSVAPGTPGATGSAPQLDFGGARIPLPTSANGRFVPSQDNTNGPLFETNPLFGLDSIHLGSEYLARLLGLTPEEQARRLGDDNYEAWLIQEQLESATGRSVLAAYYGAGDMIEALYDNAAEEAERLELGFGRALTPEQVASLKSDIVWMVEQEIQGEKVLVPVVYLSEATRAEIGPRSSMSGYNVNIDAGALRNQGGDITATNQLAVRTTGNIENLSGRMAGWNVRLDAGGDIVNSTLTRRIGTDENGRDVAERTGTIEAGGTAILQAARDVNVSGAWVLAGRDAALIAGRNVTVESQALTIDQTSGAGDDSYERSTQVLQGGGVIAGRNAVIEGQNDVNITGADVAAGDTAVLRAKEGNVNIGVRELTDTTRSTETYSGRYDTIDRDVENMQLGIGMGTETRTATHESTQTVGVGSRISGSGVVVATGRGDVNITGSDIAAGTDGVVIDSARDVNILAQHDSRVSTDTVDSQRTGVRIDGNYDGVHVGSQFAGDTTTTHTAQTQARTSGITSGGDVVIRASGDIDNEGTRIGAAGDVIMSGENITNRAAHDTYSTSTTRESWDTRQQVGFTANGTGSSIAGAAEGKDQEVTVNNLEAQMRVTASYANETDGVAARTAHGTDIKAGGNVVIVARNAARDEGTQYQAGENILISADSYENRAAESVVTVEGDGTRGSGQLTGGLTSAAEVAVTASAEGSRDDSTETETTAVTGSMRAGGSVSINARRGDVTLEGTQIEGQKGVGIRAAGDVNLLQTNDTTSREGSGESGSARLSGSVAVTGTSGGVGVGASGRTYQQGETTSTARTVNIRSGDGSVSIAAGRDIKSQGTNIDAQQDIALSAGRDIDLAAATNTTTRTGRADGGGADVNVGVGMGSAKGTGSGSVVVDAERSRTSYSETDEKGSTINAGNRLTINAGRDARLEGTEAQATEADLRTGGNLTLESAQRTVSEDSYTVNAHVEASASKGQGSRGASSVGAGSTGGSGGNGGSTSGGNAGGGNIGADVTRDYQDVETNTNTSIATRGRTTINTGGDLNLAGANVDAAGVSGTVGGDLNIESRVDREVVSTADVNAYVGVGTVGGSTANNAFDKGQDRTQMAANAAAQTGVYADVQANDKDNRTVGRASGISGGPNGIQMTVQGDTTLTGAANQASDFDTRGTTTVTDVETRTSESSIDERIAVTVASAAGADRGKGGDFSLSVNIPDGPAARRGSAGANDADPATRPRPTPAAPNANQEAPTRRANPPSANDSDAQTRPRPDAVLANHRNANPDAPTRPRPDSAQPNTPNANPDAPTRPRADAVLANNRNANPDAPTRPRPDTAQPNPNANRDQPAPDAPRRPAPTGSQNDDARRPVGDEYNTEPVMPTVRRDDASPAAPERPTNPSNADARNAPETTARRNDEAPAAPERRANTSDYENDESTPATGRNVSQDLAAIAQRNPQAADGPRRVPPAAPLDFSTRRRLEGDPQLSIMLGNGTLIPGNERLEFERVLAEVDAYTSRPEHADQRAPMLDRMRTALNGPRQDENGLWQFPVRPIYVGEDVEGFGNWHLRRAERLANSTEAQPRDPLPAGTEFANPPVRYFTPEEQARNRLLVDDNGKLFLGDRDKPLPPDGKYMFVVDLEGRIILGEQEIGRVHHSSLSGGRPVRMAGEIEMVNGKIIRLTNQSGHFHPSADALNAMLAELKDSRLPFAEQARYDVQNVQTAPSNHPMLQPLELPPLQQDAPRVPAATPPDDSRVSPPPVGWRGPRGRAPAPADARDSVEELRLAA